MVKKIAFANDAKSQQQRQPHKEYKPTKLSMKAVVGRAPAITS
jgi:hypothetical protein